MKTRFSVLAMAVLMVIGCATAPKIDLTTFEPDRSPKIVIPPICKPKYEAPLPLVAVVNFTNNSTFDYAQVVQ
ncbi:MAG: hypothetical protein N2Z74_04680, partial [Syntrophales bacterium]|nr:hypothetical protein [Syntrophales bacterium]